MRLLFLVLGLLAIAVAAPAAQKPSSSRSAKSAATATTAAPVNLNTATQAQLESLPGIGSSAAQRILEYRQKSGSFKKIEDILEIRSSGPVLLSNRQFGIQRLVSQSLRKSQETSSGLASGGSNGGSTLIDGDDERLASRGSASVERL